MEQQKNYRYIGDVSLPHALKPFTGHHCCGPKIKSKEEATENFKGANPFNIPAYALIRPYPADAPQRDRGRPGGFCRCNRPRVCCPTVHRHKIKIEAPGQVKEVERAKRLEEPTCSSERSRSSQRNRISAREGPPSPGRRARQGARPPPEASTQDSPTALAGACGA